MPKKQKDNRYRAKITVGYDAEGVAVYKYVSARTKKELEEAKVAALAHYIDGEQRRQDSLLKDYMVQWYKAKKEPRLSDSSKEGYHTYIYSHILPVFGDRMMRAIQPLEIQQWLNAYAGKSKTIITMVSSIMKAVYKSAYGEGIVSRDPTLGLIIPKPSEASKKRAFTPEECVRIENTIKSHKDGLFMGVLYYLGLRCGEALGLKWGDIDFKRKIVTLERDIDYKGSSSGKVGEMKSQAAYREVPIPDDLYPLLINMRGLPSMFLFSPGGNRPMPRTTYQRMWMSLMNDAGFAKPVEHDEDKTEANLDAEKKKRKDIRFEYECEITPHYFRHDYTTMLYNAGIDPMVAMRILGHADYATTAHIYTHLNSQHISDAGIRISNSRGKEKVAEKLPDTTKQ